VISSVYVFIDVWLIFILSLNKVMRTEAIVACFEILSEVVRNSWPRLC
jgi:hypothetical protein